MGRPLSRRVARRKRRAPHFSSAKIFSHKADEEALAVLKERLRQRAGSNGGVSQAWVQRLRLLDSGGFLGRWLLVTPTRGLRLPARIFRARLRYQLGLAPAGLPVGLQGCGDGKYEGHADIHLHLTRIAS